MPKDKNAAKNTSTREHLFLILIVLQFVFISLLFLKSQKIHVPLVSIGTYPESEREIKSESTNIFELPFTGEQARLREVDWESLENEILEVLGNEKDNYAVFIKDLVTGQSYELNEETNFPPASIYKVALATIILSDIDRGNLSLSDVYLVTEKQKTYETDPLAKREGNYNITIEELIEYLIVYSDNTAMTTLEHRTGGVYELQDRMSEELGIDGITRIPHKTSAKAVGDIFEGLYNEEYLTRETNEILMNHLKNVAPWFNNRIVAGVPDDIEVAHKIGNLSDVHEDAGIVYSEERDYILVVLNDNIVISEAAETIEEISRVTYGYLNE